MTTLTARRQGFADGVVVDDQTGNGVSPLLPGKGIQQDPGRAGQCLNANR